MSRRPPCHHDCDQLLGELGCDELVIVYRLGDQLGYVAAGRDARLTVSARRMGDVGLLAICRDRGVDVEGLIGPGDTDVRQGSGAADGSPAAAPAGTSEGQVVADG